MSPRPVPLTAAVFLTAGSALLLAGCGGEGQDPTASPTQTPDSTVAPTTVAPVPDKVDDATTVTPTARPQSQCCWTAWGNHYACGNYPAGSNGGFCNNDVTTTCNGNVDCADLDPPSTTPAPPSTTWTRPTTTTTTLPEGACVKTQSSGCLNGQSYDFSSHFTCGKGANLDVYKWGESSCCAEGLTYNPHEIFCCNSRLNSHSDGQCHEFDPSDNPRGCRCPSVSSHFTEVTEESDVTAATDTVIIDTQDWQSPAVNPCLMAEGAMSCLNGFLLDPSTDTVCGQYIVKGDTHGCCPTRDGIKVYNYETESCCQFGNDGDVRPGRHQCQCRRWPSAHCAGALSTVTV